MPQRQVGFIGHTIILHLMRVNGASPTLLVLWLSFSALVSGLVWPLGGYDGIFLGFRESEVANNARIVTFPWGWKPIDSNKHKA